MEEDKEVIIRAKSILENIIGDILKMWTLMYCEKVKETLWKKDGILYSDENIILRKPVLEEKVNFSNYNMKIQ